MRSSVKHSESLKSNVESNQPREKQKNKKPNKNQVSNSLTKEGPLLNSNASNSKNKSSKKINSKSLLKARQGNLDCINPNAAGIDIGAKEIYVSIPDNRDSECIRAFETHTAALHDLCNWLKKCGVNSAAMEATGNYWVPLYEIMEKYELNPILVDPRSTKNVTGRKSDVSDCEWLRTLLYYGLIQGAFRPPEEVVALRGYMRQRRLLIEHRSPHVLHMNKALIEMNLRLGNVISDITGATGLRIIRAIVNGRRDPKYLSSLRDKKCKSSEEVIEQSLTGHYKEEQIYALKQALELYDHYTSLIEDCDSEIKEAAEKITDKISSADIQEKFFEEWEKEDEKRKLRKEQGEKIPEKKIKCRKRNASKNKFQNMDGWEVSYRKFGADLTRLDGISEQTSFVILSEIGTDMSPWKTCKHFSSWLGLSPNNKISGGRVLSSRTKRSRNRVTQALKLAAYSLHNSDSALGAYYRRMQNKHGTEKAITCVAHKLARLVYNTLAHGQEYVDIGQEKYEQQYKEKQMRALRKKAAEFGLELVKQVA
ncbi:MAG: IS110 family transposase [Candidatus Paceibacterota bacterium]|jgi:transposase